MIPPGNRSNYILRKLLTTQPYSKVLDACGELLEMYCCYCTKLGEELCKRLGLWNDRGKSAHVHRRMRMWHTLAYRGEYGHVDDKERAAERQIGILVSCVVQLHKHRVVCIDAEAVEAADSGHPGRHAVRRGGVEDEHEAQGHVASAANRNGGVCWRHFPAQPCRHGRALPGAANQPVQGPPRSTDRACCLCACSSHSPPTACACLRAQILQDSGRRFTTASASANQAQLKALSKDHIFVCEPFSGPAFEKLVAMEAR